MGLEDRGWTVGANPSALWFAQSTQPSDDGIVTIPSLETPIAASSKKSRPNNDKEKLLNLPEDLPSDTTNTPTNAVHVPVRALKYLRTAVY